MILVMGKVLVEPEDLGAFVSLAREVTRHTRLEPGCLHYAFAADLAEPNCLWLTESWADLESLAAHGQTAHIAVFRRENAKLRVRSFSAKRYVGTDETVLVARGEG